MRPAISARLAIRPVKTCRSAVELTPDVSIYSVCRASKRPPPPSQLGSRESPGSPAGAFVVSGIHKPKIFGSTIRRLVCLLHNACDVEDFVEQVRCIWSARS